MVCIRPCYTLENTDSVIGFPLKSNPYIYIYIYIFIFYLSERLC